MRLIGLVMYLLVIGVAIILPCCIWGWAVNKVIKNKGYDENWFWWGFFFGLIALIVALTKPQNSNSGNNTNFDEIKKYKELLDSGIITEDEFNRKKEDLLKL